MCSLLPDTLLDVSPVIFQRCLLMWSFPFSRDENVLALQQAASVRRISHREEYVFKVFQRLPLHTQHSGCFESQTRSRRRRSTLSDSFMCAGRGLTVCLSLCGVCSKLAPCSPKSELCGRQLSVCFLTSFLIQKVAHGELEWYDSIASDPKKLSAVVVSFFARCAPENSACKQRAKKNSFCIAQYKAWI